MATKSNGKGQAHGSSRSHTQSGKGNSAHKQHKGAASTPHAKDRQHEKTSASARPGKARSSSESKSSSRREHKRPAGESGSHKQPPERATASRGQSESQQADTSKRQNKGRVSGMARKVTQTAKQHPIVTAALSAGAGLLLVEGVRRAVTGGLRGKSQRAGSGEASDEQSSSEESADRGDESDEGGAVGSSDAGSDEDDDDEDDGSRRAPEARTRDDLFGDEADQPPLARSLRRGLSTLGRYGKDGLSRVGAAARGGAASMSHAAREGYEHGQQLAAEGWQNHPLFICAAALALGATAGMLLPSSDLEDQAMGPASDRLTGRIRSTSRKLLRQGKHLAGKAYDEAADTAVREAERVGLTPDRLGRKVKRLASKVRDAVTDAVQG
jgi:hypothetical protein